MTLQEVISSLLRAGSSASPYVASRDRLERPILSIMDEFSQAAFAPAANMHAIGPLRPELDLDILNPGALFVESAWNGNQGKWRYLITSSTGPKAPFVRLVKECYKRGIPTVFWNKEDPVHFDDFIGAARLFDYVLTTDGDILGKYRDILGHDRVGLMRFFAAPEIHNPRRVDSYRTGDIAFAGQYFGHKYADRRSQMSMLFGAASRFNFSIFSRMLGGDPKYQFPAPYDQFIKGSLPYSEMVKEYKRHKIFLNVNSVTSSSTMCARRVYELAASKTVVVSVHSEAIRSVFAEDEVLTVGSHEEALEAFQYLLDDSVSRARIAQRAWRRVAREHTSLDRITAIREMVGISTSKKRRRIALHVRESDVSDQLLQDLERQSVLAMPGTLLSLLISDLTETEAGTQRIDFGTASVSLDSRDMEEWDFVGVVSRDFRYGVHYLEDLVLMLDKFVAEPVVTKPIGPRGSAAADDEQAGDAVVSGAWIARSDAPSLQQLLKRTLAQSEGATSVPSLDPVYVADQFNLADTVARKQSGWEA